jgi:hypothetical protein
MYKGSLRVWYLSSYTIQRIKPVQLILSGLQEGRPGVKHQGPSPSPYARLPASQTWVSYFVIRSLSSIRTC